MIARCFPKALRLALGYGMVGLAEVGAAGRLSGIEETSWLNGRHPAYFRDAMLDASN
jgi:hypothetical protein